MSLLNILNDYFDLHPEKDMKIRVDQSWEIFKNLNTSDVLFCAYDDLIDAQLDQLNTDQYGYYTPAWLSEYKDHSKIYYEPMRVRIDRKDLVNFQNYEFSKN